MLSSHVALQVIHLEIKDVTGKRSNRIIVDLGCAVKCYYKKFIRVDNVIIMGNVQSTVIVNGVM